MACVAHLGEVARGRDRLTAAGVSVLVVVQAGHEHLARWLDAYPLPFPVVSDADRAGYRAFGLGRVGWGHFLRPAVLWGYLRLVLRGERVRRPVAGEDVLQLGGDFLLDRQRRVVLARPSRAATDRPAVADILAAVRADGGGG